MMAEANLSEFQEQADGRHSLRLAGSALLLGLLAFLLFLACALVATSEGGARGIRAGLITILVLSAVACDLLGIVIGFLAVRAKPRRTMAVIGLAVSVIVFVIVFGLFAFVLIH